MLNRGFYQDKYEAGSILGLPLRCHQVQLQVWHQVSRHCLQLLGGRVEELYEAWDFQRRFGGSTRAATEPADAAEGERPPQFKTFVPGKTRVPRRASPPAEIVPTRHRCLPQPADQHDGCARLPVRSPCWPLLPRQACSC